VSLYAPPPPPPAPFPQRESPFKRARGAIAGVLALIVGLASKLKAVLLLRPWMWLVGFAMLAAAAIFFPNPIVFLILIFGALETWRRFKTRKDPGQRAYYKVRPGTRVAIAVTYVGLAIALVLAMDATHLTRTFANA
jgi:hypothetical protein